MAARLVDAGHAVVGLVHSNNIIRANDGRILPAKNFSGSFPKPGEITILCGDVAACGLGLTQQIQQQLRKNTDLILHCAAITAFDAVSSQYEAINVSGTANVRALAPDARFLYVSTAYVCGSKDGPVAEAPRDPAVSFLNNYEASKAAAEKLLLANGGNIVIARPTIVIGAHDCGTIGSFDTIYAVFRLIAEGRVSVLPVAENAVLDFVPIDHVAAGLLDIITHWEKAEGKIIHLSSGAPISVKMLVDAIGAFDQLDRPSLVDPDQFSIEQLPPKQRRLYQRTASFYASYFQRSPLFIANNLPSISGRHCPVIDDAALRRMIGYCIQEGFLRAER